MNSVIKDLYEGKICPIGQYSQTLQHFREKWREAEESYEKLLEKTNMEVGQEMEAFMDKYWKIVSMELEQSFSTGFTLGVKMMCEVFMVESDKTYLEELVGKEEV